MPKPTVSKPIRGQQKSALKIDQQRKIKGDLK
jgi:hypothetical protein